MRRFNWQIWAGFLISLVTLFSWFSVFVKWPVTRDFPWASVRLLGTAAVLVFVGLRRGFSPGRFRLFRILISSVIAVLSVAVLAMFVFVVFVASRRLPASQGAPQVGQKAPDFTLDDASGKPVSLSELIAAAGPSAHKGVLLIFYMNSGCRACNSEFRGVQKDLGRFEAMGIRPVAISVDPPEASRNLSREAGYTFTFLSDPNLNVIRRYDLADPDEGARPAEFLVDATGTVRWRNLTDNYYVRARPETILDAAKTLLQ